MLEILIALVVILILATILIPFFRCALEKSRVASRLHDIRAARDVVESYIFENGDAPTTLQAAYDAQARGTPRPPYLFYCSTTQTDPNAGHGNDCDKFDEDNPSGQGGPPFTLPGGYYVLMTDRPLAPVCQDVELAWVTCCGRPPQILKVGEKLGDKTVGGGGGGGGGGGKGGKGGG